jgi:hypothetical protein
MSSFLMIVMFFVTPPALGDNRPWALQSTHSSEFNSWEACDDAIRVHLLPVVQTTDTISLIGFCLPKDFKGVEQKQALKELKTIDSQLFGKKGADLNSMLSQKSTQVDKAKSEVGSCYSYIPPPVPIDGARSKSTAGQITTGIVGTCVKP